MKKGFTLIELLIAILLFGFMAMSLATIYSTANKHMFQQYRHNAVKSAASVAMKDIIKSSIEMIDTLYQRKGMITGLPTGFVELDQQLAGLQPADLVERRAGQRRGVAVRRGDRDVHLADGPVERVVRRRQHDRVASRRAIQISFLSCSS